LYHLWGSHVDDWHKIRARRHDCPWCANPAFLAYNLSPTGTPRHGVCRFNWTIRRFLPGWRYNDDMERLYRNEPAGIHSSTIMEYVMRVPAVIVYMIIAFNVTAFTVLLQLDFLIFQSVIIKIIAWALTIGAWYLAYLKRDQVWSIF
jgi:hypothetical protein